MKLINAKQLEGHALRARDGAIGNVRDFYFDDHSWAIRYCEVETGEWLRSRKVLLSPEVFRAYDTAQKNFPVDLTMMQVRDSPPIDTDQPVSRQHEEELRRYYGWPPYWGLGAVSDTVGGTAMALPMAPVFEGPAPAPTGDPQLRSVNDTLGYRIEAIDGPIGHAHDFLIDSENWRIRYLVIDTRNWWPGRKVVIAPAWIDQIDWATATITIELTRDLVQRSLEYDPSAAASDPSYGEKLHDRYRLSRQQIREQALAGGRLHPR